MFFQEVNIPSFSVSQEFLLLLEGNRLSKVVEYGKWGTVKVQVSGSQSVVSGPAARASPGHLLKIQIPNPQLLPTESEILRV